MTHSYPTPQTAASAIAVFAGQVLLVRRRNPPAADLYAFPGGRSEPGETLEETALRELEEETGVTATNPRLYAFYDLKAEGDGDGPPSHFLLSVFRVDVEGISAVVAADDALEADWFPLEDAAKLPAPPSVLECIESLAREQEAG
ncbi:NUDIX hydrolase [Agrobacterium sp. ES01]|uniref:NUDIX hydrolase n=1 Tax=Agrobacterium sp. ES01 TaxID=3420714 RepID=UPI003D0CDE00